MESEITENAFLWRQQRVKVFCKDCQAWKGFECWLRPPHWAGPNCQRRPQTMEKSFCFEGVPKE
jgi:hypothetical protein